MFSGHGVIRQGTLAYPARAVSMKKMKDLTLVFFWVRILVYMPFYMPKIMFT